jgi:hypothetical protein
MKLPQPACSLLAVGCYLLAVNCSERLRWIADRAGHFGKAVKGAPSPMSQKLSLRRQ